MRKATTEILADVSGNSLGRKRSVSMITRRTSQSSKLPQRSTVSRTKAWPRRPQKPGLRSSPAPKGLTQTLRPRTCSRAVSVARPAHAVGNPGRRAETTWPAQAFCRCSYVPGWPALLRPAIAVRSHRPKRRRRAGRFQRSEANAIAWTHAA